MIPMKPVSKYPPGTPVLPGEIGKDADGNPVIQGPGQLQKPQETSMTVHISKPGIANEGFCGTRLSGQISVAPQFAGQSDCESCIRAFREDPWPTGQEIVHILNKAAENAYCGKQLIGLKPGSEVMHFVVPPDITKATCAACMEIFPETKKPRTIIPRVLSADNERDLTEDYLVAQGPGEHRGGGWHLVEPTTERRRLDIMGYAEKAIHGWPSAIRRAAQAEADEVKYTDAIAGLERKIEQQRRMIEDKAIEILDLKAALEYAQERNKTLEKDCKTAETRVDMLDELYHRTKEEGVLVADRLQARLDQRGSSDLTLRELQTNLPWSIRYSQDFRSNPQSHKDFAHGLTHVHKAAGMLSALVDDMDHDRATADDPELRATYGKYIADLVVCALRMANTFPGGILDLQAATEDRIERKNGVKLPRRNQDGSSGLHDRAGGPYSTGRLGDYPPEDA